MLAFFLLYLKKIKFMKKNIIALVLVLGTLSVHAQELKWETNIDKAMEVSSKTKKPMLLFFTGSDWCGWCIRLQNEVLKTPEFTKWANENVVLVELDLLKKKYPNLILVPDFTACNILHSHQSKILTEWPNKTEIPNDKILEKVISKIGKDTTLIFAIPK